MTLVFVFFIIISAPLLISGTAHSAVALLFSTPFLSLFAVALPAFALVLAVAVALVRHPVHSLLCLITVFFIAVVLFVSAKSEFLALTFLIVYVGAIAILFLFVIMLLNVKELVSAPVSKFVLSQVAAFHFAVPSSAVLTSSIALAIGSFISKSDIVQFGTEPTSVSFLIDFVSYRFLDIHMFSEQLYTYYCCTFSLTALLLLTAMLGAIILASSASDAEEL